MFEINSLKLGATSNIVDELQKIKFQKIKGLKLLNVFESKLAAENHKIKYLEFSMKKNILSK